MEKVVRLVLKHKETENEKVLYLKPLNDEDDYILPEMVAINRECFHVLVDEGYVNTHYYYECKYWYIKQLSVMVED